jgi:hypothetical protein
MTGFASPKSAFSMVSPHFSQTKTDISFRPGNVDFTRQVGQTIVSSPL